MLGPVQLQLVAPVAAPVKVKVAPAQIGLGLADALTPVGIVFTIIDKVLAVLLPHAFVATTESVPEVEAPE